MTDPFAQPLVLDVIAELRGVSHAYSNDSDPVIALRRVDLDVLAGECLAVMGRS